MKSINPLFKKKTKKKTVDRIILPKLIDYFWQNRLIAFYQQIDRLIDFRSNVDAATFKRSFAEKNMHGMTR